MRTRFRAALVAVVAAAAAAPAAGEVRPRGVYIEAIGVNTRPETSRLRDPATSPGRDQEIEMETDYGFGAAVGYAFGNGLRVEGETTLRVLDFGRFTGSALGLAAPSAELDGDALTLPAMVNGFYDLDLGLSVDGLPLAAYVGAGVGISYFAVSNAGIGLDLDDWVFAYQAMAGLRMRLSPRLFLRAGYKYFATADAQLGTTEMSYATHNLEVGLAWQFGTFAAAPGAPPAAPPPVAAAVDVRRAGTYVEAFGTANATGTASLEDPRLPPGTSARLDYDSKRQGYLDNRAGAGVAVGRAFGGGWRGELEAVYRDLGHQALQGGGFGLVGDRSLGGSTTIGSASLNGFYDIDAGWAVQGMPVVPYVGAGLGYANARLRVPNAGIDGEDDAFAVQAMAGVRLLVRPHLYARLGYRYYRTTEIEIERTRFHVALSDVTFGIGWQF